MTSKKIFGFIFIAIAVVLSIAIIGQLTSIFATLLDFFQIFTGKLDSYQTGNVLGRVVYWIIHFAATITLWVIGTKWVKKRKPTNPEINN